MFIYFRDTTLGVAWIYRDPVSVFYSRRLRWPYLKGVGKFISEWNKANLSALEAKERRMKIVQYEDLATRKRVFRKLCKFLAVNGENLFRQGHNSGYENLLADDIERIQSDTKHTFKAMRAQRIKQRIQRDRTSQEHRQP